MNDYWEIFPTATIYILLEVFYQGLQPYISCVTFAWIFLCKAPFPYARFRWLVSARVSAKEKVYFHARGNASAESRNSLGRR